MSRTPRPTPRALAWSLVLVASCASPRLSEPPGPVTSRPAAAPADQLARELTLSRAVHKPGSSHRDLDVFVGEWSVRVEGRNRVQDSFAPLASGSGRIDWILGERFLDWRVSLQVAEKRHDVRGYLGYDVVRDEVQALWLSDLTTQMAVARGSGRPSGRGIVFTAPEADAARSVIRVLDEDSFVIESTGGDPAGAVGVLRRTLYSRRFAGTDGP